MHKESHFSIKNITKVEGHANLDVKYAKGRVTDCRFSIMETQRFFENMLIGRHYFEVPQIVARICGLCSTSHLTTALEAVEKAFAFPASKQTMLLRELSVNGEFLKSHAIHLLFLALPDYLGKESILKFDKKEHKYIHLGLDLKKLGTDILKVVGSIPYHTVDIRVGGFSRLPQQQQLDALLQLLEKGRSRAIEAIELFASFKDQYTFERKTEYVGLVGKEYCFLCGTIESTTGVKMREEDYRKYLHEFVLPYSTARSVEFNGSEYMVGALARINLNRRELFLEERKLIKDLDLRFPNNSPFYNNIAQAIELLQCIDTSIIILNELKLRKEPLPAVKPRPAIGIGVTEAPRGVLYHEYEFDAGGHITDAHIIVPSQQNTRNTEEDIKQFLPPLMKKRMPRLAIELELEKLVRAYDPCISCATHFLKVNWK